MTTTRWLNHEEQRAWRAWLDLHANLSARINRHLQATSGLSLSDYDVLVALTDDDVPDHSMRMNALGERLQWEKSRVSKQVSRMATRGLVARRDCVDDRRGAFVALTEDGLAALEAAAPSHVEQVRSLVFDGLSAEDVARMEQLSRTILARLADGTRVEAQQG